MWTHLSCVILLLLDWFCLQWDLWCVITVFGNVIILAFVPCFYYFVSNNVKYLCLSSYLFHCVSFVYPLPQTTSEVMHISAIFPPYYIPCIHRWGTLILVTNFLITFIALPPPLSSDSAFCHLFQAAVSLVRSVLLKYHTCFSILFLVLTSGMFSISNSVFILHCPNSSLFLLSVTAAWILLQLVVI